MNQDNKLWFSFFSSLLLRRHNPTEKKLLIEISDRQKMVDVVDIIKLFIYIMVSTVPCGEALPEASTKAIQPLVGGLGPIQ